MSVEIAIAAFRAENWGRTFRPQFHIAGTVFFSLRRLAAKAMETPSPER